MIRLISVALLLFTAVLAELTISQLTDPNFPDKIQSDRYLTNNKRLFKAYKDRLMIVLLKCQGLISANLYINGHMIPLNPNKPDQNFNMEVNITEYLKDGNDNTFSIQNIQPSTAKIQANVPYPTLVHGKPEEVGISPKLLKVVEDLITSEVKQGFPGAALIIIKNGKIVKQDAYGYARKYTDTGKPMDKFQDLKNDTLFDMASNTKMFSAIFSLMNLRYKEKLDYTRTLHSYIKDYKGKDSKGHDREKIDVIDVLTHIAGYQSTYSFYVKSVGCYSRDKHTTAKCIYENVDLVRAKGGAPVYSDIDYILAGLLVENIASMNLSEYARENIYKPLGLKRTTYSPLKHGFVKTDAAATEILGNTRNGTITFPDVRKIVIQGEVHDEVSYYSMNETSGHAGLFSTTGDMAVLTQVLLNKGGYGDIKLWDKETQDLFVKPYDLDLTYGIGWRRQANEDCTWHFGAYASNEAIGHTGWTGTVTVIDPKYDLSIILLTNMRHSLFINGRFIADVFETGIYGSIINLIYESFLNA